MIESGILAALIALAIHNAPAGAVSAVSGKVVTTIWDRVRESMQQDKEPVNQLQRAVRKVYLQATLEVCHAVYKKWGVASELQKRSNDAFTRPLEEIQERIWVDKVCKAIQEEIKQLPNAKYQPPSTGSEEVEWLLPSKGDNAEEIIQHFRTNLKQTLLTELRRHGEPPALFVDTLQNGWEKAGKQTDWFDWLSALFVCELQTNQSIANIFQGELLVNLTRNQVPLISDKIDIVLEALSKQQGFLLQELRRRSLSEQYAAKDIAERVEKIASEYTKLFVGREAELQQLDEFVQHNSNSVLLVTARAGDGKSALLANWRQLRHGDGCFVAYHCFNYREDDTKSPVNAYRNLLRQLYIYYELEERIIPADLNGLQDMLLIIKDMKARENEPLIIVLDGLDEADGDIDASAFSQLPENSFVLASVRSLDGKIPGYLPRWLQNALTMQVESLQPEAIRSWIEQFGSSRLSEIAQDEEFINTLHATTDGFPLYLQYLIEELSEAVEQGKDVRKLLAQTPHGFEEYVKQQIKCLDELNLPDERWLFFALLTVAKGVLSKEDVKNVTGMRDRDLRQLQEFWQVTRWMQITDEGYAFAHPLLATLFAQQLEDDATDALQKLRDYCGKWQQHQSFYALRHYAEHLREAQQWERLYSLARDSAFATIQRKHLPEAPDLPLDTIRKALLGAAETDNAGAMAEFLLLHAKRQTTARNAARVALAGAAKWQFNPGAATGGFV